MHLCRDERGRLQNKLHYQLGMVEAVFLKIEYPDLMRCIFSSLVAAFISLLPPFVWPDETSITLDDLPHLVPS
ncbi:MAG TPA: hypothetical protein DEA75_11875 [Rhodobacteraceae bacterium]|nr:hypothetical protein [Paracoccaceae bacterium]